MSGAVLRRYGEELGLEHPANAHRVCKCRRVRVGDVEVHRSLEHGTAHYGNLVICGSVWACPVCASKVAERRREEIAQGFAYAYGAGYKILMVTLTFPHTAWQSVDTLLNHQKDALRRLRSGQVWQRVRRSVGYGGMIRSLEITHGRSGWHPHTHEAWLVDPYTDAAAFRDQISQRWSACCRRAGLLPDNRTEAFEQHAVDVIDNATSSDYLQKQDESRHWGADRELAGGSTKRSKGRHPFRLLADAADGDDQAAHLFREYVLATKGRAQLFWSQGLKGVAGIKQTSDEALAEEERDCADCLAVLETRHWNAVIRSDARADLLDLAETGGYAAIADWFEQRGLPAPDNPDNGGAPPAAPP